MGTVYALAELISDYILDGDGEPKTSNITNSTRPTISSSNSIPPMVNGGSIGSFMSELVALILFIYML